LDREKIERICIDDFAIKRRYRYGTIMIDIDTRCVIDIIESREQKEVAEWLATFPNIKVVARDGSSQYAAAIKQAHPMAIQVSDRFHLIKNLTEYAKQHISKILSSNIRIPAGEGEECIEGGYWEKQNFLSADLPERGHSMAIKRKQVVVENVRSLSAQGISGRVIAKEIGLSKSTVSKYLDINFDPANKGYGSKRPSKLKPYIDDINRLLIERRPFKEIEAVIRADGYNGAASTIRMYATRQRRIMKATYAKTATGTVLIERKWLVKLLYHPLEKVKEITESQLIRIINKYPDIGSLYDAVRSFKTILSTRNVAEIDAWIEAAAQFGIEGVNSFIKGLVSDLDAVKNAIRYEYSNGLAEGKINRLKIIKRIMYGRNSFNLLRNKILTDGFM